MANETSGTSSNDVISFQDQKNKRSTSRWEPADSKTHGTGSGGGGGGGMESRIAKLESDVGHINTTLNDVRQEFREFAKENKISALKTHIWGAVFVILGGVATAYIAMDGKVTTLFEGQNSINLELGKLSGSLNFNHDNKENSGAKAETQEELQKLWDEAKPINKPSSVSKDKKQ